MLFIVPVVLEEWDEVIKKEEIGWIANLFKQYHSMLFVDKKQLSVPGADKACRKVINIATARLYGVGYPIPPLAQICNLCVVFNCNKLIIIT